MPATARAWAGSYLASKSFAEATTALRDRLVDMGFEEQEAEAAIEADPTPDQGLWGERRRPAPSTRVMVEADPAALAAARAAAPEKLAVETDAEGRGVIRVTGFLREAEKAEVEAMLPAPAAQAFREQVAAYEAEHAHAASPAELGRAFVAPRLMARVQGELVLADTERLAEYFDWSIRDRGAQLSPSEFSVGETADAFEIDLDGERLTLSHRD